MSVNKKCTDGTCCRVNSRHVPGCEKRETFLAEKAADPNTRCLCPPPGEQGLPFMKDCPKHRTGAYAGAKMTDGADVPPASRLDDIQRSGWCAPSACGAGICTPEETHDPDCQGPGWAYKMLATAGRSMLTLPQLTVKRGGIRWGRFRVETLILPVDGRRWYNRTRWELHIRYHDGERHMHHRMEFDQRDLAENAKQIIQFMMKWTNETYEEEGARR